MSELTTANLERCPICYKAPEFILDGSSWRGGCKKDFPNAVLQPFQMFDQVVIQWNRVVSDFKGKGA